MHEIGPKLTKELKNGIEIKLNKSRGALPKNMWRVCAATLIDPIFKLPVTEWPPFYFSHFALT